MTSQNRDVKTSSSYIDLDDQTNDNTVDLYCVCQGLGCLVLFGGVCGFMSGCIAWYVFGIMGLMEISNEELHNVCPTSNLWVYQLSVMIYTMLGVFTQAKSKKDDETIATNVLTFFMSTGIGVWGIVEVYNNKCVTDSIIKYTILYNISKVTCIIHSCVAVIFIILLHVLIYLGCMSKRSSNTSTQQIV